MAFVNSVPGAIEPTGSGERYGNDNTVLSAPGGATAGRFGKLDAGELKTVTAKGDTAAGVVLRNVAGPVDELPTGVTENQSFVRAGLVSVDFESVSADPEPFASVFMKPNGAAAEAADSTSNKELTNAEFIREVKDGVWIVRLK